MRSSDEAAPDTGIEAGALTADRYLGRPVLSRMYCTSRSSLVLTSRAVTNLVFSMSALSTRFGIDACRPLPSL